MTNACDAQSPYIFILPVFNGFNALALNPLGIGNVETQIHKRIDSDILIRRIQLYFKLFFAVFTHFIFPLLVTFPALLSADC